jgi:peptidoglycan/xylan/chitin deacetylase (PgdA/CDA1 family)
MYHEVTPRPATAFAKYSVTPKAFAAQMRWLAWAGYTPVPMGALVASPHGSAPLPRRAVVITFDDGFRDCARFALPVLQRRGFTAMFYLVAGLVGRTSRWMASGSGQLALADWTDVRALQAAGMQCGAHSMSHPALATCSAATIRDELVDSRRILEDRLGREILHFAYPYGSVTPGVRALAAEAGYVSACTGEKRLATERDDPLLLPRVPVYGRESLVDFICRLRTAESPRHLLRRKAPPVARRLARLLTRRGG